MKLISDAQRQRKGSHYLCGNVSCRVPLEQPLTRVSMKSRDGVSFSSLICETCQAKIGGVGSKVEVDGETVY